MTNTTEISPTEPLPSRPGWGAFRKCYTEPQGEADDMAIDWLLAVRRFGLTQANEMYPR